MKIHKDYAKKKFLKELNYTCHDFILHGIRNNSSERVELHFAIANVIYEFQTGNINTRVITRASDYADFKEILIIHDKTQKITSNLDIEIGYPVDKSVFVDTEKLSKKLARKLIKLFEIDLE